MKKFDSRTVAIIVMLLVSTAVIWWLVKHPAPSPEVQKQQKEYLQAQRVVQRARDEKARQEDEERRWRDHQNYLASEIITELQTKTVWVFYGNACYMKYYSGGGDG